MSLHDLLTERKLAIDILRRLSEGDSDAMSEVPALLNAVKDREDKYSLAESEKKARKDRRAQQKGRKGSGKFEVASRIENGTDHGATGLVLARKGNLRLVWRSGANYFSGIGMTAYAPADLEVLGTQRTGGSITESQFKYRQGGWRLTKKLIMEYAKRIDEIFGCGTAAAVSELKGTVVCDE